MSRYVAADPIKSPMWQQPTEQGVEESMRADNVSGLCECRSMSEVWQNVEGEVLYSEW